MSKLITEYQKPDTELKEQLREIQKQEKKTQLDELLDEAPDGDVTEEG